MSAGQWFWLLWVFCFLFGGWWIFTAFALPVFGGSLVLFVLIGLIGWKVFGPPLQ